VLSLAEPFRASGTWIQLVNPLIAIVMKGLALFVLWAAAESWLRSTVPNFRTSLDALRAGRLGPAGGRALLAGWSIGAMAAGLWLLAMAVGTLLPGVGPTAGSVHVPIFSAEASPIDEGAIRTGIVLLAICAGMRLPVVRRVRGSATVLTALGLTCRLALTSFWFSCVVGLILGIVLVRAYTHFGLTALLAAALTSAVLPAALFSLLHFSWLTSSALLLLATAAAPLVFGSIGIRRPEGVEDGPYTLPAFVRRLEEENRVKYEMELLAKMQLGLLPRETPRVDGYEIAARSILATEAGGDLYDFVHDANGRIWIAAGDVSGHGYSCAIAQAMTKAGLASLVEAERTPAVVLDRLDRVLRGMGAPRTFTSLALLRLDPPSGEVLLSNAGHPYPWLACANGETRELELPSLPLGQGPPRQYADTPLTIDSGSVLVLSSDGLFEGTDANGHAYGFERIREVLAKVSRRPAEAILAAIIDDWRAHVGAAAPADDTTVVVVKRK
jgi:sigma-B regulation protein RsbU (phosphoserine phosphatase)